MLNFKKEQTMNNRLFLTVLLSLSMIVVGCTDLKEEILNEKNGSETVANPQNANMLLAAAYASLRSYIDDKTVWGINEITTDELAYPARGTDGYVPDRQAMFAHKYKPDNVRIRDGWNDIMSAISKTNTSLLYLSQLEQTEIIKSYMSEVRFIRMLFMYHINDIWGIVPFRDYDETNYMESPRILSRGEALDLMITELTQKILPGLKEKAELPYGRVSKDAARMLLAKIYLNYEVYTGVSKWKEVISLCDDIIATSSYQLADDYFALFHFDNAAYAARTEAILSIVYDASLGIGGYTWPQQVLHYSQTFGTFTSLWNLACTTQTFVDTWDTSDSRFKDTSMQSVYGFNLGFLVGQQYSPAGVPLQTRLGVPLSFTPDFDIYNSREEQGIRVLKYAPNPQASVVDASSNDFLIYRYADVILMKAEAQFRDNQKDEALVTINILRNARRVSPYQSVNLETILNERGYELYWEGHRRNDFIRFGKYCEPRQQKDYETPEYMILLPIPQTAMEANSELKQNPGY